MNDDALLIAQLEDKAVQAADRYMITSGNFLDSHQRRKSHARFCFSSVVLNMTAQVWAPACQRLSVPSACSVPGTRAMSHQPEISGAARSNWRY